MFITGTHFNYYQICRRKLWLFANGINFEQTSDLVHEGKLIHEESYPQRSSKYEEVEIDGIKVDFYDAKNKVIHEIKKSDKVEIAHEWQLKYYMYVFERNGIEEVTGVLEYPKLRKTSEVLLSDIDRETIVEMEGEIAEIITGETCPPREKKTICRRCSYQDFCYSGEIYEE
ncbi:CRISPR-associated protein Cas4 [Bacteroides heparinolyticus]|uniref:CRISPR-associated protein Cas4 n=1 Tax=Prevotella heparinolytica TaxID=28113 RepID=UPI0035A1D367